MFKRKVGRPTNKSIKRRRNIRLVGIALVLSFAIICLVSLDNFISNNLNKLNASVTEWTEGGIHYTCPSGYEKGTDSISTCVKYTQAYSHTSCNYKLNKDSSYVGYTWNDSTKKCEKVVSKAKAKCTYGTYVADWDKCNYASRGFKCPSGGTKYTPPVSDGKIHCTFTPVPDSQRCNAGRVLRGDNCIAQKDKKQYYYCGNDRDNINNVSYTGKCIETTPAIQSKGNLTLSNISYVNGVFSFKVSTSKGKLSKVEYKTDTGSYQTIQTLNVSTSTSVSKAVSSGSFKITHEYGDSIVINVKTMINTLSSKTNNDSVSKGSNNSSNNNNNNNSNNKTETQVYTITYHANGGSGADYTDEVHYGKTYTTWDNWYTRNGYTFTGWNERADGKGVDWTAWINKGWVWTYTKNVNLYAQWKKNDSGSSTVQNQKYTITYHSNGGSGKDYTESVTYGSKYKTWENWYSRSGYTFTGWNERADGKGVDWTAWINKDWNWTYTKNVNLYAQWKKSDYTITYHANGGTGKDYTESVAYGSNYKTWGNWYSRSGYTFTGWNERADGKGVDWTAWINKDWNWTYTKNVNLYAQWKKNEASVYTITYHPNGASGSDYTDEVHYGKTYTTWSNWYMRTGYEFVGWNERADGKGVDWTAWINKGWVWTYKKNVNLYAQWKKSSLSPTKYGWSNGKFYDRGNLVTNAYVEAGATSAQYVYVNSSGSPDFSKKFIWIQGLGSNSSKWWFAQNNNQNNYVSGKSVTICGYTSSREKCTNFSFDSAGWCSKDNYKCNW